MRQLIIGPDTISIMKARGQVGLYNQPLQKMKHYRHPTPASRGRVTRLYLYGIPGSARDGIGKKKAQYRGQWKDRFGFWREAIWR